MAYKRAHIFYSGRVQGVGFRYTVRNIASQLKLLGLARNLPDGRVEVVCEGKEKDIGQFLDRVVKEFSNRYIINVDISWQEATQEFKTFSIEA
ncbi:MAG: acylphosphatase [Candidatus Omnitrophica bacterium]|nr:acylphosphatase [Candidatus Omnitrophota bacterium]MBU4149434.1 acylphosphatase [Candidatus Omnitrophota bacterium]